MPQVRFMIRRATQEVWIWSEMLSQQTDLEEVWAEKPDEALLRPKMPDPRQVSIEQIEGMTKADLLIFGGVKLGIEMPENETKAQLQDRAKEALLLAPTRAAMVAAEQTGPFVTAREMTAKAGMKVELPPKGASGASANANQPVQS